MKVWKAERVDSRLAGPRLQGLAGLGGVGSRWGSDRGSWRPSPGVQPEAAITSPTSVMFMRSSS